MKTTEFLDWLHEYSFGTVMTTFMAIGLFSEVIALTIIYFITRH